MSLNCNELDVILGELDIEGAFIQEVVQPGFDTMALRLVKGVTVSTLLVCTGASACRLNLTGQRAPKNDKPLRFQQFMRSRVQGMRINGVRQLGLDRIVRFDVSTWKERLVMYARLWSGAANVIVTQEDGTILDCMFRRPKRGEVSGGTFIPQEKEPTPQEREAALERFPVRTFDGVQFAPKPDGTELSFNEKIDFFYAEKSTALSREQLLAQAQKWHEQKKSRMEAALQHLLKKQAEFSGAEKLRHYGDLILAFQSQAQGTLLTCTDYDTGQQVNIHLDAHKTPQQNAAEYYAQYKKAQSGAEDLAHDIAVARRAIAELDAQYDAMQNERNVMRLEQMLRRDTTPRQKAEKTRAGLEYDIDGWKILVGRTAAENDDLLRHSVKGQDVWLHTRDYAGGYVFVKAQRNKTVPLDILLYAGTLAVYYSKARKNGQADLYYTQVKFLRRAKDGPKGLVLPTQEKNLFVKLDETRLRTLQDGQPQSAP